MKISLIVLLMLNVILAKSQTFTVINVFNGPVINTVTKKEVHTGDILSQEQLKYSQKNSVVVCSVNTKSDEGTIKLNRSHDPRAGIIHEHYSIFSFLDMRHHNYGHRSTKIIDTLTDISDLFSGYQSCKVNLLIIDSLRIKLNGKSFGDTTHHKFFIKYKSENDSIANPLSYAHNANEPHNIFLKFDRNIFFDGESFVDPINIEQYQLCYYNTDDPKKSFYQVATFKIRYTTLKELRAQINVIYKNSKLNASSDLPCKIVNLLDYLENYYGTLAEVDLKDKIAIFSKIR